MSSELTIIRGNEVAVLSDREPLSFLGIVPKTIAEIRQMAEVFAASDLVPAAYRGKPGNVMVAWQYGAELGISYMQALRSIAVINGNPALWGQMRLALCQRHPDYVDTDVKVSGEGESLAVTVTCKRRGRSDKTRTFSWKDAVKGRLTEKDTYKMWGVDMITHRAMKRATDAQWSDVLQGVACIEEEQAIEAARDVTPEPAPTGATDKLLAKMDKNTGRVVEEPQTSRGAALWARWQADEALPQRLPAGQKGRNDAVNSGLQAILGDKLATVRVFENGTDEQLDAIEEFLDTPETVDTDGAHTVGPRSDNELYNAAVNAATDFVRSAVKKEQTGNEVTIQAPDPALLVPASADILKSYYALCSKKGFLSDDLAKEKAGKLAVDLSTGEVNMLMDFLKAVE